MTSIRHAICHSSRQLLLLVLPIPSLSMNEVISGQEASLVFITSARDVPNLKLLRWTSFLRVDLLLKRKFIKVVSATNSLELNSIRSTATSWVFTGCWDHAVQMGIEMNLILTSSQAQHVWDAVCLPALELRCHLCPGLWQKLVNWFFYSKLPSHRSFSCQVRRPLRASFCSWF